MSVKQSLLSPPRGASDEASNTAGSRGDGQRRRTRLALLAAAARLIAAGAAPSVAEVADAADVSRRTAYRYFPTQD
ncbi:MAG: TetR family transcriptional regulator, partial [Gemmatimonadaceae bacterium]